VRVGAAPTKPGCVSTARWRGLGEHGREEYVRNWCCKVSQRYTGSNLADAGRERCIPVPGEPGVGNSAGVVKPNSGEAGLKVCGVGAAKPQGQSQAPPRSSEQQ